MTVYRQIEEPYGQFRWFWVPIKCYVVQGAAHLQTSLPNYPRSPSAPPGSTLESISTGVRNVRNLWNMKNLYGKRSRRRGEVWRGLLGLPELFSFRMASRPFHNCDPQSLNSWAELWSEEDAEGVASSCGIDCHLIQIGPSTRTLFSRRARSKICKNSLIVFFHWRIAIIVIIQFCWCVGGFSPHPHCTIPTSLSPPRLWQIIEPFKEKLISNVIQMLLHFPSPSLAQS